MRPRDERPVPRAQPRDHRGRQPRRHHGADPGAFRAQDLPLIGGGDTYYAVFTESGGLKANDEVRIAGVRVGKVDEVELAGDQVGSPSRSTTRLDFGAETAAAIKDQDAARRDVPGARAGRLRPARRGRRRSRGRAPPRRTTWWRRSRAWPRPPSRSTPTSSPSRSPRWPTSPATPPRSSAAPSTAWPAVGQRRGARRPDQLAAAEPRPRLDRPRRPRPGHRHADGGRRRAVPGAGRSAAQADPRPAGLHLAALQELTLLVRQCRADLKPALDPPRERGRRCSTRTRTTSTTACG